MIEFTQRLPTGVPESAAFLGGALGDYPTKVDLSGIDLHGHYWRDAHLDAVLLRDSDLRAVDVSVGSLTGILLEGALLACANFEGAELRGAHLEGADLSFSNLRGANLSEVVGLTIDQLAGISYDDETSFPESVVAADLEPSGAYTDTRTCAKEHLLVD